jgi:hypothetical protein
MSRLPSRLVRRFNHTPDQYDVLTPPEWSQLQILAQANHWSPYPAYSVQPTFIDEILRPTPTQDHYDLPDFVHFLAIFCSQTEWSFDIVWNGDPVSSTAILVPSTWTYAIPVPYYPPSGMSRIRVLTVNCGVNGTDPVLLGSRNLPDPATRSSVSLRFTPRSTATPLCRIVARCLSPQS